MRVIPGGRGILTLEHSSKMRYSIMYTIMNLNLLNYTLASCIYSFYGKYPITIAGCVRFVEKGGGGGQVCSKFHWLELSTRMRSLIDQV